MRCFKCGKEIDGLRSFLPLDRPYVNLPFHRKCYKSLDDEMEFCTQNYDRIIEYIDELYTKSNKK
jgi:hypothetical protein